MRKTLVWVWFIFSVHGENVYIKYPVGSMVECVANVGKYYPQILKDYPDAIALCQRTQAPIESPRPMPKPEAY